MEKISVIVPVYNVQKYIEKCVGSLINQTYKNIEIILVNDGSTDRSGECCSELAKTDSRIVVIHKKKGGLSDARNCGIEASTGEYLTFIDSDDYVENDYIEYLYEIAKSADADIAMCGFIGEDENSYAVKMHVRSPQNSGVYSPKEAYSCLMYQNGFDVSAWAKLYRKKIFEELRFTVGIWYEDFDIANKTILKSNRIAYGERCLYHYVQHSGSIMDKNRFDSRMITLFELSSRVYNMYKDDPELSQAVSWRYVYSCFVILNRLLKTQSENEYKKEYIKLHEIIKQMGRKALLNNKVALKYKVAIIIESFFPSFYRILIRR